MLNWSNYADDYNPQILFICHGKLDATKNNYNLEYHYHDFIELSIITSGEVDYIIDGKNYLFKKGQVVITNPGVYHTEVIKEKCKCSQLHIGINKINLSEKGSNYIDINGENPFIDFSIYNSELLKCCNEIITEQDEKKIGYPLVLKSLVMKILIIIYRELEGESQDEENYPCSFEWREKKNIVDSVIQYMNTNYMKDISLDKLSKNMYLSTVYLSKIFKEETGDSPINYLIKIRLAKAKELLKKKKMPIKVVAQSVGYKDAYHFSKLFKKYYGIAPSMVD